MLNYFKIPLIAGFLLFADQISAQVVRGGNPVSWTLDNASTLELSYHQLPGLQSNEIEALEEAELGRKDLPFRFAKNFDVFLNPQNSGRWTHLKNGDRIWMLGVSSPGALAISITFNEFELPEGAKLFIYNTDRTEVLGALTNENNNLAGSLGTTHISGEQVIVEYYEPFNVRGQGNLNINAISHAFRFVDSEVRAFGNSGQCNVDVDCISGEDEKSVASSVVLITVGNGTRWATGTMLNNTSENGKPYLLTSHSSLLGNPANWVIYFNYNSVSCQSEEKYSPLGRSVSGATLVSSDAHNNFALLELNSLPPQEWGVHLAGWNRSAELPENARCIHHPGGDVKKSSFTNHSPQQLADVWVVSNWTEGVTEPGSVGAPIVDDAQRVFGILIDGTSSCDMYGADAFVRFDKCWDGESKNGRLKDWLDPHNTGLTSIGAIFPSEAYLNEYVQINAFALYPNPAHSNVGLIINVETNRNIELLDVSGRLLRNYPYNSNILDIQGLQSGIYIISIYDLQGNRHSNRLIKD